MNLGGFGVLKKIFFIMCCIMLFNLSFSLAPQNVHATDITELSLTEEDYGKYAIWFIANDIYTGNSEWTEQTRISNIVPIKKLDNTLIGYTFELETKGDNSGYIFVKYNELNTEFSIAEYSYADKPLYLIPKIKGNVRDVYNDGLGTYFILATSNKLFDVEGNEVDRNLVDTSNPSKKIKHNDVNDELKNLKISLDEWMVGYNGQLTEASGTNAGITNTYQYVIDRYGSNWVYTTNKILPVSAYLQSAFNSNDRNNCVLSSVTTVLKYYQQYKGYSNIPNNIYTIYADVRTIAIAHGYTISGGTPFSKINNIVTDAFAKYGYTSVKGNSDYLLSYSTFRNEIDNNRPVLFSNVNGYYGGHNFVVIGYRTYTSGSSAKEFLRVNDNWTTSERWYDYSAFSCCGSLTHLTK